MNALIALALLLACPQEDRETIPKVYKNVQPSFVAVEITLRKKSRIEKAEIEQNEPDPQVLRLLSLSETRQTLDAWGVVLEKNLILLPDFAATSRDVEKLQLTDASGKTFSGTLHAVGRRHDFVLVKPEDGVDLNPIEFADWDPIKPGEYFYVTYADRSDGFWELNVSPYIMTNAPLIPDRRGGWYCMDPIRPGSVISDRSGATVGIALDRYLWVLPDGRSSFLGKGLLKDERITDLEAKYAELHKAVPPRVYRVKITFRAEKASDFGRRSLPDPKADQTILFGVAVDERGTILLSQELQRDQVRKIEEIRVVEGSSQHEAEFLGSIKEFGAMLVRAKGLKTKSGIVPEAGVPPLGELFFTARFEDRFGRNRMKTGYNRIFRTEKGLRGEPRLQPVRRMNPGTFLLNDAGGVTGFATYDHKEEDLDELAMRRAESSYYMSRALSRHTPYYLHRLIFFSEIAEILAKPESHFDPGAVPMTRKEEKTLVWLGIEFQGLSKPLAKALGVQERDLTNDGRRGLLVTLIYPGSPAEKAGFQVDDILLSIHPEGDSTARDFVAQTDPYAIMRSRFSSRLRGGAGWRTTRNYLNTMLTEIGAGRKVEIAYLRGGKKSKTSIKLANAPTDFETAERHKDESLGITVKELTYEVRHFEKLEPSVGGVVLSKVESGTPASVAKLEPYSVVLRVNGVSIRDLEHFKTLLGGNGNLTLTVISLGRTRLAEIVRE